MTRNKNPMTCCEEEKGGGREMERDLFVPEEEEDGDVLRYFEDIFGYKFLRRVRRKDLTLF